MSLRNGIDFDPYAYEQAEPNEVFDHWQKFGNYLSDDDYTPELGQVFHVYIDRNGLSNDEDKLYVMMTEVKPGKAPIGVYVKMTVDQDQNVLVFTNYKPRRLQKYRFARNRRVHYIGDAGADTANEMAGNHREALEAYVGLVRWLYELWYDKQPQHRKDMYAIYGKNQTVKQSLTEKERDERIKMLCEIPEGVFRHIRCFSDHVHIDWSMLEKIQHLRPFH